MLKIFVFSSKLEVFSFLILAIIFIPFTTYIRLRTLSNPLIFEPHGRQMQPALTTYYMAKDQASFFDYRSPYNGKLWSLMAEFPLYQYLSSRLMKFFGLSLEIASRLVALLFLLGVLFSFLLLFLN